MRRVRLRQRVDNGWVRDTFELERFVRAQAGGTYERALAELRAARKETHWMWFVFPQIAGLGRSATAREYAISSQAEARAYLEHPVLGPRLLECSHAVLEAQARSAQELLGAVDAMKLRSSMTLFMCACGEEPVFGAVLARWFDAGEDPATLALLAGSTGG